MLPGRSSLGAPGRKSLVDVRIPEAILLSGHSIPLLPPGQNKPSRKEINKILVNVTYKIPICVNMRWWNAASFTAQEVRFQRKARSRRNSQMVHRKMCESKLKKKKNQKPSHSYCNKWWRRRPRATRVVRGKEVLQAGITWSRYLSSGFAFLR